MPLSDTVRLAGKFPDDLITPPMMMAPVDDHFYTYLTNALVIPEGHDQPGFDVKQAPAPLDRLTNADWLVATVEFDWETSPSWTGTSVVSQR